MKNNCSKVIAHSILNEAGLPFAGNEHLYYVIISHLDRLLNDSMDDVKMSIKGQSTEIRNKEEFE